MTIKTKHSPKANKHCTTKSGFNKRKFIIKNENHQTFKHIQMNIFFFCSLTDHTNEPIRHIPDGIGMTFSLNKS